jgi:hypothetical protein
MENDALTLALTTELTTELTIKVNDAAQCILIIVRMSHRPAMSQASSPITKIDPAVFQKRLRCRNWHKPETQLILKSITDERPPMSTTYVPWHNHANNNN